MDCCRHRKIRTIKIPHLIYQIATGRIPKMCSGIFNIFWPFAVFLLSCSEATIHKTDSMLLPLHVCYYQWNGTSHLCSGRYPLESFLSEISINSTKLVHLRILTCKKKQPNLVVLESLFHEKNPGLVGKQPCAQSAPKRTRLKPDLWIPM